MSENIERFNSVASTNSIVRSTTIDGYVTSDDIDTPFTLGEWLVNVSEKLGSPDEYVQGHTAYIREWYAKKKSVNIDVKVEIVNNYAKFLKEILLIFPSNEEYRYIKNLDWSSPYDLDIAVPYYTTRLREIILYIVDQRDRIRFQKVKNSLRGSIVGTTKHIYDHIIAALQSEDYVKKYGNRLPTIQHVAKDLNVTIDETYDVTEDYNNQSLDSLTLSGEATLDSMIITDFDRAVRTILQEFPRALADDADLLTTEGDLTLEPDIETDLTAVSGLPASYFINYAKHVDNLNLHTQKKWFERYSGTDMYYLSSNDSNDWVFEKFLTSDSKVSNHLNTQIPSVVYAPKNNITNKSKIGGLFTNTGITHVYSLNTTYRLNTDEILPNTYTALADPNIYGTKHDWLVFEEKHDWMKADRSNDMLQGHIVDTANIQKMYPYQSVTESNTYPKHGVSRVTDRFDFWKGDLRDVWANEDVYKVIEPQDYTKPRQDRIEDLLLTHESMTNWQTDIHGNEYVLYKPLGIAKQYEQYVGVDSLTCKVLDGEIFWDDVTWERPKYDTYVDGTSSFLGWSLSDYNEYAYGGYFSPYECEQFDCFCPCEEYKL